MTKNALRAVDAKTFSGKIHNDIKSWTGNTSAGVDINTSVYIQGKQK